MRIGESRREPALEQFGRAVRDARQALGISQEELAARCELHRTYVAGVERGIRNPSLKSIAKIANGLGLSASLLFERVESVSRERGATREQENRRVRSTNVPTPRQRRASQASRGPKPTASAAARSA
jgi:transcriptional regulator with XRE-family HTH domain